MSKTWITADQHFGHGNLLTFQDRTGGYFRGDRFSSVEEMDAAMISAWNETVSSGDKVYQLGDFAMTTNRSRMIDLASRLNGRKILIRGNHDRAKLSVYSECFRDVRATHLLATGRSDVTHLLLSHVPIHPNSLRSGWVNIHGHTHHKGSPDGPFFSACVELHDYKPIALERIPVLFLAAIAAEVW